MQEIPRGQTLTYGELAKKLQTGPRAIGAACRTNPIPVIIPCHRIVSKQGMGGFHGKTSGKFLTIKEWLLQHEGAL
ncbi:methylated-DNA--[protein]-cysteine S-methyltransferase [Piscirickettsia litoralis]|uniref:methylated-DNA--[protein]-cysteine S-methyltransferase n=1 Tax=Piscirickettsia litoralis TaxID=1891921 RepID=UPI000A85395A|nr:MGMT family protein [Piscirickettsia litoralis]